MEAREVRLMATCSHPKARKRFRYRVIRGYRVREELCRECRNAYWREHRKIRRGFGILVRLPVLT